MEKWEVFYVASRNIKWYSCIKKSLAALQKSNHRVSVWSSHFTPRISSRWIKNMYPHKNLYKNVCSLIIPSSQKVKTIQMPIYWWIDKENTAYPYNVVLFNHIKEWNTYGSIFQWGWNLKTLWEVKEARYKRPHTVWFHYMRCLECYRQNHRDGKQINSFKGPSSEGNEQWRLMGTEFLWGRMFWN